MKHFNEWANNKSLLLAIASLVIAGSVEYCLELLEMFKVGKRIEGETKLPSIQEWLSLYRNHRRVYYGVTDEFRSLNDTTAKALDIYELMMGGFNQIKGMTPEEINREIQKLTQEKQQEIINTAITYTGVIQEFIAINVIGNDSKKENEPDNDTKKRVRAIQAKPEMIYFLRVFLPCWLFYGDYPVNILRKARHGDEDAIEKLYRLDDSIIHDPKIMEIHHQAKVSKKQSMRYCFKTATGKTPKMKLDLKKIKYNLAGLISIISIVMGQKLTAKEIDDLFNVIARDKGDEAYDPDHIINDESFEKAIQRAKTFWQTIPKPDKK